MNINIGLRTIKTGVAVALCLFFGELFKLNNPFFAVVAAIITMEKTVGGSYTAGKNRIVGTAIGALVGLLCAFILPGNPVACGLAVILLIIICNYLSIHSAISVGCMVLVAIMTNANDPLFYSFSRLFDTCVGIIIALLVNISIFPYNSYNKVKTAYKALDLEMAECVWTLHQKNHISNLEALKNKIEAVENGLIACESELHTQSVYEDIRLLEAKTAQIKEMYTHIEVLENLLNNHEIGSKNTLEHRQIVYNYHLERFKEKYNEAHFLHQSEIQEEPVQHLPHPLMKLLSGYFIKS